MGLVVPQGGDLRKLDATPRKRSLKENPTARVTVSAMLFFDFSRPHP
jgi:hypothetical protein